MSVSLPKPTKRVRTPKPLRRSTQRIKVRRPAGTVRREAKAAGDLTQEQWARICAFYEVDGTVRCAYGQGERATEQDHVKPLGKGGRHTASNVVPVCYVHNQRKGQQTWPVPRPHPFMEAK